MDDVDKAIFNGWRFLALEPSDVLNKTPRDFSLLMEAQKERTYDEYERLADLSLMQRYANNAKRVKRSDLFHRPIDEEVAKARAEEAKAKAEHTMQWLSQFEEFSGKEGVKTNE